MTTGRRFAAVCVMLATMTVALSACAGDNQGSSSGTSAASAVENTAGAAASTTGGDGTTGGGTDAPERSRITIAIPQDIDSLDPHIAKAAGTREVLFNVYEGLVKPDENGNILPAIASEYSMNEDATVYTFTLREAVLFHDGTTVTAEDVKYSLERCMDAESAAYQSTLAPVKEVNIVDEHTVEVVLTNGDTDFAPILTTAVIPAANEDPEGNPVGTGPYRYVARKAMQSLELEKFEDYWNKDRAAQIDECYFKIESDVNTLTMGLQNGTIDMFCRLTTEQTEQLSGSADVEILEGAMNLVVAVYLNNAEAPFDDARVRQALSYAADPQELMDFVLDGKGTAVGSSMFPSFGKYFDDSLTDTYAVDIEKAKALLAEAGYPDGFTFTLTVPSNYDQYVEMSGVLREEFARIGVTMEIQPVEWNSWLDDVYGGRNYQATIVGVDASTMTAAAMLSRFRSTAHNNFVNYSSAAYDAAYDRALAATDDAEKTAAYKECLQILNEDAANVYLMDMPNLVALNKRFTGYAFYPLYVQDIALIGPAQ
ncbi:MAG: ABC transporter substrate-binding protein [Lachnospiraceae bacterium]|nr:ABC transporter substrate-binding protein [Lachnospiraceae bacterium]